MSYSKQNFVNGQILSASQLNSMDDVIAQSDKALEFKDDTPYRKTLLASEDHPNYIYHVINQSEFGPGAEKHYAVYECVNASTYYMSGSAHSNTAGYPLGAWYDEDGELISTFGTDGGQTYTEYEVTAPTNAKTFILNSSVFGVGVSAIALIESTGSQTIDELLDDVDNLKIRVKKLEGDEDNEDVEKGVPLDPTSTVTGYLYHVLNKTTYQSGAAAHAFFPVKEGNWYFVSGCSASNTVGYPLGAFYSEAGTYLESFGQEAGTIYTDELVQAPAGAVTMVVNKSRGDATLAVSNGVVLATDDRSYQLNIADALIREAKKNPFNFAQFPEGMVTFVFDDLCTDLDSVASIFEEYDMPFGIAAIPDRLDTQATYLQATRGSFTPGMTMREIMNIAVQNGAEIMTHNSSPVVTVDNQDDYNFMFKHFIGSKQKLEAAGFTIRGHIRAGGTGVISGTPQIERWLIGNYEYSNQGTAENYCQDRVTIQQPQADLKAAILSAYTNHEWLKFMCHSYDFGGGTTFTGEADLRELLEYCQSLGIRVVTYATVFDEFSSSKLMEAIKVL